jgi:predicted O-methyltransferase YrrM
MNRLFTAKEYLHYRLKARHRQGFGVHSPFVFSLLNEVFYEKSCYYCYESLEKLRQRLLINKEQIEVEDFGKGHYTQRSIASIAKKSVKSAKYSQLLFRLANMNSSRTILEVGTALGITTMYLASANTKAQVMTIEGDRNLCTYAQKNFEQQKLTNISLHCGKIDDLLPDLLASTDQLDFVFFDANHTKEATLRYAEWCFSKAHSSTIFVIDDIHWSASMKEAWLYIKQDKRVRLSIDIFEMGILFFNTDLIKQEYIVAF